MPKFQELSEENKRVFKSIIGVILNRFESTDVKFKLCVTTSGDAHIIDADGYQLTDAQRHPLGAALNLLESAGLIAYNRSELLRFNPAVLFRNAMVVREGRLVPPVEVASAATIPSFKISNFDEGKLGAFLRPNIRRDAVSPPSGVDAQIWDLIPREIKDNWSKFNGELQAHIVTCMGENVPQRLAEIQATFVLGDTLHSPISWSTVNIPVRLFETEKFFDLKELLETKRRARTAEDVRHPLTREVFKLEDIRAAPDGLALLIDRLRKEEQLPVNVVEVDISEPKEDEGSSLRVKR